MKKLLDHDINLEAWEVSSDSSTGFTNLARTGKRIKTFQKNVILANHTNPKQERARPVLYNRFPLPKARLSNGVVP